MIIINTKYDEATKQMIVKNYREGMRVSEIISHYGIPKSTVYSWIKHSVETSACKKESSICNFHTLKEQVEKQNAMIKILQKAYGAKEKSLKEKLSLAETLYSEYRMKV